jgi:hypothetical protein
VLQDLFDAAAEIGFHLGCQFGFSIHRPAAAIGEAGLIGRIDGGIDQLLGGFNVAGSLGNDQQIGEEKAAFLRQVIAMFLTPLRRINVI